MSYWLAGLLAAGTAWITNRLVVKYWGDLAVVWVIPWLEEIIKTGIAIFSGASLILTHGVFGLLEAVHDYMASPRWGIIAGFSSIISHCFYGWVTAFINARISFWLGSALVAAFLHVCWNYVMVRLFGSLQERN